MIIILSEEDSFDLCYAHSSDEFLHTVKIKYDSRPLTLWFAFTINARGE